MDVCVAPVMLQQYIVTLAHAWSYLSAMLIGLGKTGTLPLIKEFNYKLLVATDLIQGCTYVFN